jgi:hypothetical protein
MESLLQVAGALLVLAAFILAQAGRLRQDAPAYLVLNVVGSLLLAALALHGSDWGFLLLEGAWALVSAWSLTRVLRGGRDRAPLAH